MLEVKPFVAQEWPLLKTVRLKALADAPEAFSTSFAQAQAWPDDVWQHRAQHLAAQSPATAYMAYQGGEPCGMICCTLSEMSANSMGPLAEMTSFWVAPEQRGRGVGEALVAAVVDWANAQGVAVLQAWVTQGNERALAFYRKAGFQETGHRQPHEPDPSRYIALLARRL